MTTPRALLWLLAALTLGAAPAWAGAASAPPLADAVAAQPGRVTGTVTDSLSGETLIGANVRIEGTTIGAATDINGRYSVSGVPSGPQTVIVSYIGYDSQTVEVVVPDGGALELDVALAPSANSLGEAVVTAQAQGQQAAINQQLNSNTIVNIVSAERIREIPDANAAEAIGRLPGISLQRSSGEANKVVIRGLSPKFNQVLVNGIRVPSTDANDRSVDLTTISPESLAGIEVYKALPADFEADAIGGTVNLRLRTAPQGLHGYAQAQTGYNELQDSFGNYRFSGNVSNRFLDDKLGVIVGANLERVDRSADNFFGGFGFENVDETTSRIRADNVRLAETLETRNRTGGSLVADYRYGSGTVTASTFLSRLDADETYRQDYFDFRDKRHEYVIGQSSNTIDLATGSLNVLQQLGPLEIDVTGAYARSTNRSPDSREFAFTEGSAFNDGFDPLGSIELLPSFAKNNLEATSLTNVSLFDLRTEEAEATLRADVTYSFSLTDAVSGSLQVGTLLRDRDRDFNRTRQSDNLIFGGSQVYRDMIAAALPGLTPGTTTPGVLPLTAFLDPDYDPGTFLGGDFSLGYTAQLGLLNQALDAIRDTLRFDALDSFASDYDGTERYRAGYVMAELKLGPMVTFVPGLRYERMETEYTGFFIKDRGGFPTASDFADADSTVSRTNDYFFPQLLLTVRPTDWLDVRAARTRTLTRPDYNQITPRQFVPQSGDFIRRSNPFIEPARSTNYDVSIALHTPRVGLVSAGYFYKTVEGFISVSNMYLVDDCKIAGFTPPCSKSIPGAQRNASIQLPVNNPFDATIQGIEIDVQTSLWYLPSLLRGIVLNANYTHLTSRTRFPFTRLNQEIIFEPEFQVIETQVDSSRAGRLVDQPSDLINLAVGYDLARFSGRVSFQYTTNALTGVNAVRPIGDSFRPSQLRVDVSAKQGLTDEFEVYLNLNNLTSAVDRSFINTGTANPTFAEFYGLTGDLGLRYRF